MQRETSLMADRLGDSRSKAYAMTSEINVSTLIAPKPLHEFEILQRAAIKAATETTDPYIQTWTRFVIGWEEMYRGRKAARDWAGELMQVGQKFKDPRSTGFGLWLLTWIALSSSPAEALEYSEQSLAVAITPFDEMCALHGKGCALFALGRTEEGMVLINEGRRRFSAGGCLYPLVGSDTTLGMYMVLQGNIAEGIHWIEGEIFKQEKKGCRDLADTQGLTLSQIYLQIIAGNQKLSSSIFLRNFVNSSEGQDNRDGTHSRPDGARLGEPAFRSSRACRWTHPNDTRSPLQG